MIFSQQLFYRRVRTVWASAYWRGNKDLLNQKERIQESPSLSKVWTLHEGPSSQWMSKCLIVHKDSLIGFYHP